MLGGHAAIVTQDYAPICLGLDPNSRDSRVCSRRPSAGCPYRTYGNHDAAPPVSLPSGADALKRALDTPGPEKGNLRTRPRCDQRCSRGGTLLTAGRLVPAHSVLRAAED